MRREKLYVIGMILIIVVFGIVGIYANHRIKEKYKPKTTTVQDDFLKIPEYTTDLSDYANTTPTIDNNSYWFVVVQDQGGLSTMRNSFIKQEHPWFSYEEAKKEFKKDCFILNIVRVDKETYDHNQ